MKFLPCARKKSHSHTLYGRDLARPPVSPAGPTWEEGQSFGRHGHIAVTLAYGSQFLTGPLAPRSSVRAIGPVARTDVSGGRDGPPELPLSDVALDGARRRAGQGSPCRLVVRHCVGAWGRCKEAVLLYRAVISQGFRVVPWIAVREAHLVDTQRMGC